MDSITYETNQRATTEDEYDEYVKPAPLPDWTTLRVVSPEEAQRAREDEERRDRKAWENKFAAARASIPKKFEWIDAPRLAQDADGKVRFPEPSGMWKTCLPWLTRVHLRQFFDVWKSRTNLLLLGPADVGKTCMLVLHARWTLALAGYDATEVRRRREVFQAWDRQGRIETVVGHGKLGIVHKRMHAPYPGEPDTLPQVAEARGLRFMTAPQLLDDKQWNVGEANLRTAMNANALYLDELGRELYGARQNTQSWAAKRVAVMRVVEFRWPLEKPFVATSEHTLEELGDMYGNGSFRRIAGERSGATVIDLANDHWAGAWLKQQTKGQRR